MLSPQGWGGSEGRVAAWQEARVSYGLERWRFAEVTSVNPRLCCGW